MQVKTLYDGYGDVDKFKVRNNANFYGKFLHCRY